MAEYKGSVTLISGITQKNNGQFPLVAASAVQYKNEENGDGTFKSVETKIDELAAASGETDTMTEEELQGIWDEVFVDAEA